MGPRPPPPGPRCVEILPGGGPAEVGPWACGMLGSGKRCVWGLLGGTCYMLQQGTKMERRIPIVPVVGSIYRYTKVINSGKHHPALMGSTLAMPGAPTMSQIRRANLSNTVYMRSSWCVLGDPSTPPDPPLKLAGYWLPFHSDSYVAI